MKGSATTTLRSIAATSSRNSKLPLQSFSTSSCCHQPSSQAESSTSPSGRLPGESVEDAFKRNLKEVQSFRRKRDALRVKVPFIPPSTTAPPVAASPMRAALSTLLASGAALGCKSSKLDPVFAQFVYANRSGLSIIDLDQSLPILRRTASLVRDVVKDDGVVLFVGSKTGHARCLERIKERMGDNGFTSTKWVPGLLTNSQTFFGLGPMENGSYTPDLVVFLNPRENAHGVKECLLRQIPTVGIIDTDTDPRLVTYPIPANVESLRTAELIVGTLSLAGQEGRRLRLKEEESRSKRQKERRQEELGEKLRQ